MNATNGAFKRPEHVVVAAALQQMDSELLRHCGASFGGGTAAVLALGEYRLSQDIDFLCSSPAGYTDLRLAIQRDKSRALFAGHHEQVREFRADRYGIRGAIVINGQPVKVEIVREDRISLDPPTSELAGVPVLSQVDQIAEKLMANVDRQHDRSYYHRDALDLGMLIAANGGLPAESLEKVQKHYPDVAEQTVRAAAYLANKDNRNACAAGLQMTQQHSVHATRALIKACHDTWPEVAGIYLHVRRRNQSQRAECLR